MRKCAPQVIIQDKQKLSLLLVIQDKQKLSLLIIRKVGSSMEKLRVAVLKVKLHAPWVHSLKEKRMIVKSLLAKIRNKFQVSAAEVEDQDVHQSIVIGAAAIVPHSAQADSMMEEIINFIEFNTDAELIHEEWEIR